MDEKNRETEDIDTLEGERGIPSVNAAPKGKGRFLKFAGLLTFVAVMVGMAVLLFSLLVKKKDSAKVDPDKNRRGEITQTLPQKSFQPPPPEPIDPKKDTAAAKPSAGPITVKPGQGGLAPALTSLEILKNERLSSSLMDSQKTTDGVLGGLGGNLGGSRAAGLEPSGVSTGSLSSLLSSTSTPSRAAMTLKNRSTLLAKGAMIPCVLITRIDSTVPGMASCEMPQNIYSDDGKTVLAERGSLVTGEYQTELKQGQARLFVLWNRIKTPNGVVVNLDSPGTDPLGGAGMPGYIDNHFWQRFGGAILLSVIDDAFATMANLANKQGSNNTVINYQNTSQNSNNMATEALKSTISIPPTLYKNQGERISIFVARDLSFDSVYDIKPE